MGEKQQCEVRILDGSNNKKTSEDSIDKATKNQNQIINVILGLDISTTCTGISVLNKQTGNLVYMSHELMNNKKKYPDFWSKVDHMKNVFAGLHLAQPNWNVQTIAVEENAKRFTPGFSSADTILTLAKFNGILCYVAYNEFGIKPTYINVRSARAKLGIKIDYKDKSKTTKQKVLEKVVSSNPSFPWVYKGTPPRLTKINEDRCDAYVIAYAAFKK